jgi:hypothetical protein
MKWIVNLGDRIQVLRARRSINDYVSDHERILNRIGYWMLPTLFFSIVWATRYVGKSVDHQLKERVASERRKEHDAAVAVPRG